MPQLNWDPLDFLTVLAVEPLSWAAGDDRELRYHRETPPLWLSVTVWQDESRIAMSIGEEGHSNPIIAFTTFVRDGIVRHETRELEWLELRDVILVPLNYSYRDPTYIFCHEARPERYNLRLWVIPEIRFEFTR